MLKSTLILVLLICGLAPLAMAQSTQPIDSNLATQWEAMFKRDAEGFTIFPSPVGARMVLVSASDGDDANDGSAGSPVRTLSRAMSLVQNGSPSRILFKRGDVFPAPSIDAVIECGGRSPAAPMIIGAYGPVSLPRPVLKQMLSLGGKIQPNFLVLQSLDFYSDTRDPSLPGFDVAKDNPRQDFSVHMFTDGKYLWIEDCRSRFATNALDMQGQDEHFHTLIVRRCQILDTYDPGGHSQGIFVNNFDNVLIEENVFDHNGWNDAVPGAVKTIFNHNMYLQHTAKGEDRHFIVRNNISARASSHGCQLRPGGLLENNLFLKNSLAAFVADTSSVMRNNVVLDGDGIADDAPRGQGLEFLNCPTVLAEGNIIAHKRDAKNNMSAMAYNPVVKDEPVVESHGEFRNNIVYDWAGTAFDTASPSAALNFHGNLLQQQNQMLVELKQFESGYVFKDNRYFSTAPRPFRMGEQALDLNGWCGKTGESNDQPGVNFTDPARDITSYSASIHLPQTTLEGFLGAARQQRRGHWDDRLTADAVNAYIRTGFARRE
jgi:hypothetical protein